ncbi:MAG TPA: DUF3048 domain-containing protein [Patescibacteria group bacterium]|nr:DUF3048 domain-containing protein [Patescibacteria group bacterium]
MENKKLIYIIIGLVLYIVSTVGAYAVFSHGNKQSSSTTTASTSPKKSGPLDALTFDSASPKTEACPLNGVLYSKDQETWWQKHRPLGVMIENEIDARPQSGISYADVTYEAVAEGGITRTLNVFYCQDAGIVGPVRSARTYFLDFISEYGDYPLYAHVGGANTPGPADALGQIDDYGWGGYNDLNQFAIGYPTYWRDDTRQGNPNVATEHTMYSTTSKLWAIGAQRGLTNVDKKGDSWDTNFVKYSFKDDAPAVTSTASDITVHFMGDYDDYVVEWKFDKATDSYLRWNGGKAHIDVDTKKQLSAKDIIVLRMTEGQADDGYENNLHMLYGTKGTGDAEIFMDGKDIKGTWSKASRTGRLQIYNANGNELKFNRGHLWFEVLGPTEDVTVK